MTTMPDVNSPSSLPGNLIGRTEGAAVASAVPDAAMSGASFELDALGDAADRRHGSFFGRRKGHRLRAHQLDLIEQLLPRLALDTSGASPADLTKLFDRPVDAVRLEIGFGGGEHLVA